MRIAVAATALLLVVVLVPSAYGQPERETVTLLVPADVSAGSLHAQSAHHPSVRWKRVTVPIDGTVEHTVSALKESLKTTIVVERRYPLLGGEDEPDFENQWGLDNTGQHGGTPGADINVRGAWPLATGKGIVVAVVDSGVNAAHPDLVGQVVPGWDFVDNDDDPSPVGTTSDEAHGTFVAGVIAAAVNGVGMAGVAPDATIMNIRACSDGGCDTFHAVEGIYFAVDSGADVINLSFGGPFPEDIPDHPLEDAIEYARQSDVLVVTAAGNTSPDTLPDGWIMVPAELPHANNIAVAATDRHDRIAADLYYGPNIDIAAPGVEIWSTSISDYGWGDGTSFSAPHVAGVAALLKSTRPSMGYPEMAARMKAWVAKPPGVDGKVESGRLDAARVLRNQFVDIIGHIFEDDAKWAADEDLSKGCDPPENIMFCPDELVTRGQMAAFLGRHLALPTSSNDHFSDDNGTTFEADINRLAAAGITKGCNPPDNDRFCPKDNVTREQMAAFLVRALGLASDDHPGFDDVSGSNIFFHDIERLATAGVTRGCNPPQNSLFCPKAEVTRGQMTAFLHRSGD